MRDLPLAGLTVAVTRPRAGEVAERLRAAGARVVHIPLIAIEPPTDGGEGMRVGWDRLTAFAWVVLTSVNGVDAVARVADGVPPEPPYWAAVGRATSEALAALGRKASVVPRRQDATGLAAELPAPTAGDRLLLIQAEVPTTDWASELCAKWEVERVAAYRTVPADPSPAELSALRSADIVTLASPSAAENLARLGQVPARTVCIGQTTAAAARQRGITVVATAADPSAAAFTSAVIWAVGLPR